ncbi:hypothetical protein Q4503_09235 [Colwellia sp. 6_MG-2023]|uniref:hypothetical protein n=1 Tax=Colwellia sp. 6_MG-2023 TaxID=3062676 RepID=UPI0026E2C599|nr:hypothetical protein [Colwellia sp. 6_MG-2023]MDO6487883.1 hypothetical protein [Colwellia sp. 6_MG-2023]
MIKLLSLLILGITISGYIFVSRFHLTKLIITKDAGQHLFYKSIANGISIWIISFILFLLSWPLTSKATWIWDFSLWFIGTDKLEIIDFRLGIITLNSIFLAFFLPSFAFYIAKIILKRSALESSRVFRLNQILIKSKKTISSKDKKKYKRLLNSVLSSDVQMLVLRRIAPLDLSSEFSGLFIRSADTGFPIAFTLTSRKVYIGYIPELPLGHVNDITIIPLISGYRRNDDLSLIYVTPYNMVDEVMNDGNKFQITLPIREILHANLHDVKLAKQFKCVETTFKNSLEKHEP